MAIERLTIGAATTIHWEARRTTTASSFWEEGWFTSRLEVNGIHAVVFAHLFSGDFLVNGNPVGRLPCSIVSHPDFQTLFGAVNFSSTALGANAFRTRWPYIVGGCSWVFDFSLHPAKGLRIEQFERLCDGSVGRRATYVPTTLLPKELPEQLRHQSSYAHWFSSDHATGSDGSSKVAESSSYLACQTSLRGSLEFRSINADRRQAFRPSDKLVWSARTCLVVQRNVAADVDCRTGCSGAVKKGKQDDAGASSSLWQLEKYEDRFVAAGLFSRLDGAQHIAVWRIDLEAHVLWRAELLRFGHAFQQACGGSSSEKESVRTGDWTSVGHPGYRVARCTHSPLGCGQSIGTLIGLKSKLVLEPATTAMTNLEGGTNTTDASSAKVCAHLRRLILIPKLHSLTAKRNESGFHHYVEGDHAQGWNQQLWSFEVDTRLRLICAPRTREAHLYLALLHSLTASFFPDPFLGTTGTERAVVLVRDQGHPGAHFGAHFGVHFGIDADEAMLKRLWDTVPRRSWYPAHLQTMEQVRLCPARPCQAQSDALALLLLDTSAAVAGGISAATRALHHRAFQKHELRDLRGGSRWRVTQATPTLDAPSVHAWPSLQLMTGPLMGCTEPLHDMQPPTMDDALRTGEQSVCDLLDDRTEFDLKPRPPTMSWAEWDQQPVQAQFLQLHFLAPLPESTQIERYRRLLAFKAFLAARDVQTLKLILKLRHAADTATKTTTKTLLGLQLPFGRCVDASRVEYTMRRERSMLRGFPRSDIAAHIEFSVENTEWYKNNQFDRMEAAFERSVESVATSGARHRSWSWSAEWWLLTYELREHLERILDQGILAWHLHNEYLRRFEDLYLSNGRWPASPAVVCDGATMTTVPVTTFSVSSSVPVAVGWATRCVTHGRSGSPQHGDGDDGDGDPWQRVLDAWLPPCQTMRLLGLGPRDCPLLVLLEWLWCDPPDAATYPRHTPSSWRREMQKWLETAAVDGARTILRHAHPRSWLALEAVGNFRIREDQVEIATLMLDKGVAGNSTGLVTQLDMGRGKTSVILPMLALALSDGSKLARLQVPDAVLRDNCSTLYFKLGMLTRRCFFLPCTRTAHDSASSILQTLQLALQRRGVIICSPSHVRSLSLIAGNPAEVSSAGKDGVVESAEIQTQTQSKMSFVAWWTRQHVVDVLDESDELLHPRNQLVYPHGDPELIDGSRWRWRTIQQILFELALWANKRGDDVPCQTQSGIESETPLLLRTATASVQYPQELRWVAPLKPDDAVRAGLDCVASPVTSPQQSKVASPAQRLQKYLRQYLAQKLLKTSALVGEASEVEVRQRCSFVCSSSALAANEALPWLPSLPAKLRAVLYTLRGCLAFDGLFFCLSKRHRVDYGLDLSRTSPLAVPYRAKDSPAPRAEWSHPDCLLIWTHIAWMSHGLRKKDFDTLMSALVQQRANESIYEEWRTMTNADSGAVLLPTFASINLEDATQNRHLYEVLHKHMLVILYWLDHHVLPTYARAFPRTQMASACDTARSGRHCVGFSGTNGNKEVLPVGISQVDLNFVEDTNRKTDALLRQQTMHPCLCLEALETTEQLEELQEKLNQPLQPPASTTLSGGDGGEASRSQVRLQVILDRGALFSDAARVVAQKWLAHPTCGKDLLGVVYYDSKHYRRIWSRQDARRQQNSGSEGAHCEGELFAQSPLRTQLHRCAVFLDDAHTRGVDLQLPLRTHAVVTIAKGITRDQLAQACKRMRKLDHPQDPHTLSFAASPHVFSALVAAAAQKAQSIDGTAAHYGFEDNGQQPDASPNFDFDRQTALVSPTEKTTAPLPLPLGLPRACELVTADSSTGHRCIPTATDVLRWATENQKAENVNLLLPWARQEISFERRRKAGFGTVPPFCEDDSTDLKRLYGDSLGVVSFADIAQCAPYTRFPEIQNRLLRVGGKHITSVTVPALPAVTSLSSASCMSGTQFEARSSTVHVSAGVCSASTMTHEAREAEHEYEHQRQDEEQERELEAELEEEKEAEMPPEHDPHVPKSALLRLLRDIASGAHDAPSTTAPLQSLGTRLWGRLRLTAEFCRVCKDPASLDFDVERGRKGKGASLCSAYARAPCVTLVDSRTADEVALSMEEAGVVYAPLLRRRSTRFYLRFPGRRLLQQRSLIDENPFAYVPPLFSSPAPAGAGAGSSRRVGQPWSIAMWNTNLFPRELIDGTVSGCTLEQQEETEEIERSLVGETAMVRDCAYCNGFAVWLEGTLVGTLLTRLEEKSGQHQNTKHREDQEEHLKTQQQ